MAEWNEVAQMDQVSFWIGRVSRADTGVERFLHIVHEMLGGLLGDPRWAQVPRMTAAKLKNLRAMISASRQSAADIAGCMVALDAIAAAHRARNELVHGHWSADPLQPSSLNRIGLSSDPGPPEVTWDITEFEQLFERIAHVNFVAAGLYKTVLRWSGTTFGPAWDLQASEEMAGRFIIFNINDSGGGIGASIRFTEPGMDDRIARLR